MSVQVMVSVLVLMPVTFVQSIVSVFVLIPVTSVQATVSVLALIKPFEVTRPVISPQAMLSVFVLIADMLPVPISVMRVAALALTVVTSDQLIVSVLALTASVIAARDVEAKSVWALIEETAEATWELVFVLTPEIEAPSELLAFSTFEFVVEIFVLAAASVAPSDDEALFVLLLIAV